jgi:hypothetical protein
MKTNEKIKVIDNILITFHLEDITPKKAILKSMMTKEIAEIHFKKWVPKRVVIKSHEGEIVENFRIFFWERKEIKLKFKDFKVAYEFFH